ncbi:hypothetical protein FO440_12040 [Mucilaginibacter corticis]|uniref:Uncharacterized protein n=1 Tax=Mucilaginibacter corticis TaxID=2597670 RepID=A0A556MKQ0_9SPHI|nr:hypothetical protein FO440_12040 [Mucilaginibacter corticis]
MATIAVAYVAVTQEMAIIMPVVMVAALMVMAVDTLMAIVIAHGTHTEVFTITMVFTVVYIIRALVLA